MNEKNILFYFQLVCIDVIGKKPNIRLLIRYVLFFFRNDFTVIVF